MDQSKSLVTRRALVSAGGLAAVALTTSCSLLPKELLPKETPLSVVPTPMPTTGTTREKANIQLVKDFCAAWAEDPPDIQKLTGFLSDDCVVRFGETIQPVAGPESAAALFQTFLNNGERYDLKIEEIFARGSVVVTSRTDSTVKGSRITNPTQVVGVFVLRDGKIHEWSEYV
jgi:limonene-1,2-epoxide hydrolase